jgi:ABC-2 type transport system ATP-binding protein
MNRGNVSAEGTPAQLRSSFAEPLYELQVNNAARAVEELQAVPGVIEAAMFGRALHVVTEDSTGIEDAILRALQAAGLEPRALHRVQPTLEDVFVSLVRREGGALVS